jgi:hypothetical protein
MPIIVSELEFFELMNGSNVIAFGNFKKARL